MRGKNGVEKYRKSNFKGNIYKEDDGNGKVVWFMDLICDIKSCNDSEELELEIPRLNLSSMFYEKSNIEIGTYNETIVRNGRLILRQNPINDIAIKIKAK